MLTRIACGLLILLHLMSSSQAFLSRRQPHSISTAYQPRIDERFKQQTLPQFTLSRRLNVLGALPKNDKNAPINNLWPLTLVAPLWLAYVSNQWSRYSLVYLVDFSNDATSLKAMNVDIGFNQLEYGVLASLAFTALFAVASLGAGVASDRLNRKTLFVGSTLAWSAAALGTSASATFAHVLVCRIVMGLACAFATPVAYTLIQDGGVPPNRQSVASSFYGTGVAVASGLSSLTILIDDQVGWRQALQVIALFGLLVTVFGTIVLPNDPKEATVADSSTEQKEASLVSDIAAIVSTRRVQWIYLASFLRFCSGLVIGVWGAPYYRMTFPDVQSNYAIVQAAISAVGATASGILGGVIADRLAEHGDAEFLDAGGRKLIVPVVGSLLAAPTWYLSVQTGQSFETAMLWLAAEYFIAECWFGPTVSTLQSSVKAGTGGTAQGLFTLTGAVGNLAPSVLGYLYAQSSGSGATSSSTELSVLLATGVCLGYTSSAFCFAMAALSTTDNENVTA
jgi:MFS family permease